MKGSPIFLPTHLAIQTRGAESIVSYFRADLPRVILCSVTLRPLGTVHWGHAGTLVHLSFLAAIKEREPGRFGDVPVVEMGV